MLGACNEVKQSGKFKKVLEVVLALGNYLNGGSFRGAAYGFKLDALNKLRYVAIPAHVRRVRSRAFSACVRRACAVALTYALLRARVQQRHQVGRGRLDAVALPGRSGQQQVPGSGQLGPRAQERPHSRAKYLLRPTHSSHMRTCTPHQLIVCMQQSFCPRCSPTWGR